MTPTRRTFLHSLLPLVALPWVPWRKPLQFTNGVAKFHSDAMPGKWILQSYYAFNSREWRGHAPWTVRLEFCNWIRGKGSDFMFRKHEKPGLSLPNSRGEYLLFAPFDMLYGGVDFNEFDFGEQVG